MSPLWRPLTSPTAERILAFSSLVSVAMWALCAVPAKAQETVYIGGSGLPAVEVNLEVLDELEAYADGRLLLHPGDRPQYLRRSTTPRIYGRDIFRVPSRLAGKAEKASTPARAPESRSASTTSGASQAERPLAERPLIAAKPPAPAPLKAPPLAPLPEIRTELVKRATMPPPAPLPARPIPPVTAAPVTPPVSVQRIATPVQNEPLPSTGNQKRLSELLALRDEGLISEQDYAAKRTQIVSGKPTAEDRKRLSELSAMRDEALISKADYAAKRAEIMGESSVAKPSPPAPVESVAPAPVNKQTRVAALPKRPAPTSGTQQLLLEFSAGSSSVSPSQIDQLRELASRLVNSNDRVQIRAYAGSDGDDSGNARRISLKRALAVRSRLIEYDIRSTRIDVRALGIADQGPENRVDVLTVAR